MFTKNAPPITKYVREDVLSPAEYLELMRTAPEKVRRQKFLLPEHGKRGDYGSFLVEYHLPEKKTMPFEVFIKSAMRGFRSAVDDHDSYLRDLPRWEDGGDSYLSDFPRWEDGGDSYLSDFPGWEDGSDSHIYPAADSLLKR